MKSLLSRILLAIAILLLVTLGVRETISYQRYQEAALEDTRAIAEQIRGLLMSTRRIYQKLFLDNNLPLTERTIGFLPAHTLSRISHEFPNWVNSGISFNNVSDRPRNPGNAADPEQMEAMEFFRNNPDKHVFLKKITPAQGPVYFHYARPIWVESYCLKCHGDINQAPEIIRRKYHNQSFDYEVGDLRGLMSIKIPESYVSSNFRSSFFQDVLINLATFLAIFAAVYGLLRRFVSTPLSILLEGIDALSSGHYQKRIEGLSGEFSTIGTAFNQMAHNLMEDITRRTEAEKARAASEEQMTALLMSSGEAIIGVDLKGNCTFSNHAAVTILGYHTPDELLGTNLRLLITPPEALHDQEADLPDSRMCNALKSKSTIHVDDATFYRANGDRFAVEYRTAPIKQQSEVEGIVLTFNEITERKRTEQKLNEAYAKLKEQEKHRTQRFQKVMETVQDAILVTDDQGLVVEHNPMAETMFGRDGQGLKGLTLEEIIRAKPLDNQGEALLPLTDTNATSPIRQRMELRGQRGDGAEIDLELSISSTHEGEKLLYTAFLRDISERKQLLKSLKNMLHEAESATRMKSEFLANMSHEIRTPMNAVIGLTDLAMAHSRDPRVRDYLVKIASSSQTLLRIINDILDFSKIEAGKLELEESHFYLRDTFDHVADMFRLRTREKGVELVLGYGTPCHLQLRGDALRLEQILINLIGNAFKFTETGMIDVQVQERARQEDQISLQFSIHDTGIGMNEKAVERLFNPFEQADSSTTRRYGGTGLGLTICRRLVEMMNGGIWVESEPGQGSTFHFTLQMKLPENSQQDLLSVPDEMTRLKVLVVDQKPLSRQTLEEMLEHLTFSVTPVAEDREAERLLLESMETSAPYQLLIYNQHTVEQNSAQGLRNLINSCSGHRTHHTPKALLLTNCVDESSLLDGPLGGRAFSYLSMPVNYSLLFDTIMELFEQEMTKIYRPTYEAVDLHSVRQQLAGGRILLAEDNLINQQVAVEILEAAALTVDVAENGQQAVHMVEDGDYDLVLMDIQMPLMDGYEATKQIRLKSRFHDLPIIAMTAHAMQSAKDKSLTHGMNDHINKPVCKKGLYDALTLWIQTPKNPLELEELPPPPQFDISERSPLPTSLPGIHIAAALERLNGNEQLFFSLLRDYKRDFSDVVSKIQTAIDGRREDDKVTAERLAHSVKGIAANLEAYRLYEAAYALEQAFSNGEEDRWEAYLESFSSTHQEVMEAIASISSPTPATLASDHNKPAASSHAERAEIDQEKLTPVLDEMRQLITDHNLRSQQLLDPMQQLLRDTPHLATVLKLEGELDQFDFTTALQTMERLITAIQKRG
uniref:Sensory/regulatory protein RpfC n=1 Tax=Magnetococcus massalia (strain MO-1) TaxID=451514 RepID=A0A1S7LDW2_MAGMO|nr:putative Histidine kinase with a DUF3365 domain, HAMP domain, two PAS domains, HisKA domain, HATPase c domain, Response regulator receiver domains and Hpt domain [Candidatus Magnetococcus massalia]